MCSVFTWRELEENLLGTILYCISRYNWLLLSSASTDLILSRGHSSSLEMVALVRGQGLEGCAFSLWWSYKQMLGLLVVIGCCSPEILFRRGPGLGRSARSACVGGLLEEGFCSDSWAVVGDGSEFPRLQRICWFLRALQTTAEQSLV